MSDSDDFAVRYVNLDELTNVGSSDVDVNDRNSAVYGASSLSARADKHAGSKVVQRRGNGGSETENSSAASYPPTGASTSSAPKLETIEQIIDQIGFGWFQIKLILIVGVALTADSMEMLTVSTR